MEIWKDIRGYEGLYQISSLGNIKSYPKKYQHNSIVVLKPSTNQYGYKYIGLYKNKERKSYLIHRLVAEAFIPNPNNLPQINHKDENKQNNCVDNLEWCSNEYNASYGTRNIRSSITQGTKINQYDKNNNYITSYHSINEAAKKTGISEGNISSVVQGRRKSAGGFIWEISIV